MKEKFSLIIKNTSELVTLSHHQSGPRAGREMQELSVIKDGAIVLDGKKIIAVGPTRQIIARYQASQEIDARGKTVTPGLVDPHTHLVFAGDRANEFAARLKGISYQEIARQGGGIKSTVRATRQASKDILKRKTRVHLKRFLAGGTTTIEAKSGYGLTLQDEIKILEVIKELNRVQPLEIVPTFLGAHEIPEEYQHNKPGYIKLVKDMLPVVAKRKLAEFCDIFCEKGVFGINQSREILKEARKYGLKLKLHADEFASLGGAELAAELGAVSADHLMAISDKGIKRLKEKGVIAVLLPGTTFGLGLKQYAPARQMMEAGLPIALGTDFNPGTCMTESLPMIMTLACVMMKFTPAEALVAATINAAYAIGQGDKIGSLVPGKQADIVIWDCPSYQHLPYHFGVNLASVVIKKGKIVSGV